MNAAGIALFVMVSFFLAYRFYSRYLSHRVFDLDQQGPTPAEQFRDDIDYVPTPKWVLFGHHYSSIAGAAPIVGPAVAVIWGWVPALIWIVLGTIFMGAAHDLGSLVVSMKHKGRSIGQVTENILGPRVRNLFLVVTFFLVWLVIAVFSLVIANLFISFPASVLPVNFEIIIALAMGYWGYKKRRSLFWPSILALLLLFFMIYLGTLFPISLEPLVGESERVVWICFLLVYSLIASILPVWLLLQPRDYINSHQLFVGLAALFAGLFIVQPEIVAPAFNLNPVGAPSWIPFLFITIACGAISGFHGLVSSGTSSKQVAKWSDARTVGYGGMLGEGLLALLATLAVMAGFDSFEAWHQHYGDWASAQGLSSAITAFVLGSSRFLAGVGIPESFASTMIAVLIISFAATSLDTAARIQRHVLEELGESWNIRSLQNRYVSACVAILTAALLVFIEKQGQGGLVLWPLFGATNQMLAALSMIVISVYLLRLGRPALSFLIPALILIVITAIGLIANIISFYLSGSLLLASFSALLLLIELWIIGESAWIIRKITGGTPL